MASLRFEVAWACGRTVGPASWFGAGGGCGGALVVVVGLPDGGFEVGGRAVLGYCLLAAPVAREAFEVAEPIATICSQW